MNRLLRNIPINSSKYIIKAGIWKEVEPEINSAEYERFIYFSTHKLHMPVFTITEEEYEALMKFEEESEYILKYYSVY